MTGVDSPCIRNCCLDDNDVCVGCYRSLEEITRWSIVDDKTKVQILAAAELRRAALHKSRWQPGVGEK